jgi:transposase-like protein
MKHPEEPIRCPRCASTDTIRVEAQSLEIDSWYCFTCRRSFAIRTDRRDGIERKARSG